MLHLALCIISKQSVNSNWSYSPLRNAQFGSKSAIFCPMWPCNLLDDNRKTIGHLFYVASSIVHHFIAIGELKLKLQSGNTQFGSKSVIYCPVTLKFNRWPWKTIGHLIYVASSFMHHFIAIGEFKLKFQSGNAQFGSKLVIFLSCVTFKFNGWPWKTRGHIFYAT